MEKLFINEEELKSMIPTSRNVSDTQTIFYSIKFSQIRELRPHIGERTFDDLLEKYYTTGYTMTPCELDLVDMMKEVLSLMTYKRLINHLSFKLRDGGLRYSISGSDELAPTDDRQMILREITKDVDVLLGQINIYIKENKDCFPLHSFCRVGEVKLNIGKL